MIRQHAPDFVRVDVAPVPSPASSGTTAGRNAGTTDERSNGPPAPRPGVAAAAPITAKVLDEAAIFAGESARVDARRTALGTRDFEQNQNERRSSDRTFGIALSGGGIRSATLSLGILRSLGRAGLIPYVDYLSSVSGGSYIGAFLCSRYVPSAWRGDVEVDVQASCSGGTGDPFSGTDGENALNHLRQSGRHLLPGGAGDLLRLCAIMVRSWLAIHLVIGVTLLTLFMMLKAPQVLWTTYGMEAEAGFARGGLPPQLWPSVWLHGFPVSHWFLASWLLPFALPPLFVAAALFWSYFLTRGQPRPKDGRWARALKGSGLWGAVVVAGGATSFALVKPNDAHPAAPAGAWLVAAFAVCAILAYFLAELQDARATNPQMDVATGSEAGVASARVQEDRVRHRLTRWSAACLRAAVVIAAVGLLDGAAQTIYLRYREITYPLSAGALLAVAVPLVRQLISRFGQGAEATSTLGRLLARFGRIVALVAGLLLATVTGLFWAVLAHRLTWFGKPVGEIRDSLWLTHQASYWVTVAAMAVASALIALSYSFLNLSTYANFYASSLRRAYLGASNVRRWSDRKPVAANRDHVDDDVSLDRYYSPELRAPLHLVNVTVNDTASRASNTTQRDRRGKPLVLSPLGYLHPGNGLRGELVGIPFGAVGDRQAEKLPLSTWVGVSGAAASTGMGQYGSMGLSLLAGLANLRLGYWWDPGPGQGRLGRGAIGSVQARLVDELMGRFPGTDGNRWYLTDGGHFENTGAYELIRRRVALILVCDNGADPNYDFGDLVTLARRVRIDFDAELRFIDDPAELDGLLGADTPLRHAFGSLRQLGLAKDAKAATGPYAALGRVTFGDASPKGVSPRQTSTVVWLKPRVCGAEALDLVAYARQNPPFPQQSTLDQSFSEPQWESYYRLGQLMADRLFEPSAVGTWCPRSLKPLP